MYDYDFYTDFTLGQYETCTIGSQTFGQYECCTYDCGGGYGEYDSYDGIDVSDM